MTGLNRILLALFASIIVLTACSDEALTPPENTNETLTQDKTGAIELMAGTTINTTEARLAVEYLNKIRLNPAAYSTEIGADLSYIAAKPVLRVDSILTKVAEQKAADMASRNYFNHVTPEGYGINYMINKAGYTLYSYWLRNPKANNFESIAAAYNSRYQITGIQLIKNLILDKNVPSLGHRNHLLGVGSWAGSLVDVGIGFANNPNSKYRNYMCVIIAKHR